jgi:hypothetical protein
MAGGFRAMAERIALNEKALSNVASRGKAGASWLANLPFLVQSLEDRWAIRVGRPFGNATEAYVAEALTQDGEGAALNSDRHENRPVHPQVRKTTLLVSHASIARGCLG